MKKTFFLLIVIIGVVFFFAGCSEDLLQMDTPSAVEKQGEIKQLIPEGYHVTINGDSDGLLSSTYSLDEYELNEVIDLVIEELYGFETPEIGTYVGADLSISPGFVSITPIFGESDPTTQGGKCGGKEGDGWKSYGVCRSESCVKEKSLEAVEELKKDLKSGQCMDIRVKRNTLSARVCGRLVSC